MVLCGYLRRVFLFESNRIDEKTAPRRGRGRPRRAAGGFRFCLRGRGDGGERAEKRQRHHRVQVKTRKTQASKQAGIN